MKRSSLLMACAVMLLALISLGISFSLLWSDPSGPTASYRKLLNQARRLDAQGQTAEAEKLARRAISLRSSPPSAALLFVGECARKQGRMEVALTDLSKVKGEDEQAWLQANRMVADILHYDLARFADAEEIYRRLLKASPEDRFANEGIAKLLALCGRRNEAIPFVLRLIKTGTANDLLILISREETGVSDSDLIERALAMNPEDALSWLALANTHILSGDAAAAIPALKEALSRSPKLPVAVGRLGAQLLALNRIQELDQWIKRLEESSQWTPETWLVLGQVAERNQETDSAIRCYWEALRLRPESLLATSRLSTLLQIQRHRQEAAEMRQRVAALNDLRDAQLRTIMSSAPVTRDGIAELITAYAECGRFAEAVGWATEAARSESLNSNIVSRLQDWQKRFLASPTLLTVPEFHPTLKMDFSEANLPDRVAKTSPENTHTERSAIRFQAQRSAIGFDFIYNCGSTKASHRMHELAGGGIASLDFDNDLWPDLFCSQGTLWPFDSNSSFESDPLFRNHRGEHFVRLTSDVSGLDEAQFGQGATVGDFNSDGYPDIYVANLQRNVLWSNNGDGTFSRVVVDNEEHHWTTSCLVADLNADGHPDLYDVNYLKGPDLFERTCQDSEGRVRMCLPNDFDGAQDQIWINDGAGRFHNRTKAMLDKSGNGKGLGILAFSSGPKQLHLLVANDTVPNHYLVPSNSDSEQPVAEFRDEAFRSGMAVNSNGKAEACMGIASADINDDGRLDIFVTNFLHESNTFYRNLGNDLYQDQTQRLGLQDVSLPKLGFGTQFLDANCDGRQELFVANGYIESLPDGSVPFAMEAQLFGWSDQQFQELDPGTLGEWARQKFVGRSVARFDWNRDFRPDLAIGLLNDPSFVLTNESTLTDQTSVSIRLVGTASSRDAVGTVVSCEVDGQRQTSHLTAGDGYQCSNQRSVALSGRGQPQLTELAIQWPSGHKDVFTGIETNCHYLAIEGGHLRRLKN